MRKPFELRERLWHESPELDYEKYEIFDEAQNEFKSMGVHNLEWRIKCLDGCVETQLDRDYQRWFSDSAIY